MCWIVGEGGVKICRVFRWLVLMGGVGVDFDGGLFDCFVG